MDSAARGNVMRLSDLRDVKVCTLDGDRLGRVHEVHCDKGRIVAVTCGPGSLIERLTAKMHPRRIAWESVVKLDHGQLVVAPEKPKKPSASRSRRGTRRPSAPRSKR